LCHITWFITLVSRWCFVCSIITVLVRSSTALNILYSSTFSVFAECYVITIPVVQDSNTQLGTVCCCYNMFCEHVTGTSLRHFRQCWPRGTAALSLLPPLHKPIYSTAFDTESLAWNFLGAFAKFRQAIVSFVICVPVRPYGTTLLPRDGYS